MLSYRMENECNQNNKNKKTFEPIECYWLHGGPISHDVGRSVRLSVDNEFFRAFWPLSTFFVAIVVVSKGCLRDRRGVDSDLL